MTFIAVFLLLQLLIPISYYLRDDPYDERFAWRMFSPIRQHSCRTIAREILQGETHAREIQLGRELHVAWISVLSRNRRPVIHAFLHHRCEAGNVSQVELLNVCSETTGEALEPQRYALRCGTLELQEPEEFIRPREEP